MVIIRFYVFPKIKKINVMGKKAKCKQIKCIVIEELDLKLGFDFEKYQFGKHLSNFWTC
jgi:hypothetical protein